MSLVKPCRRGVLETSCSDADLHKNKNNKDSKSQHLEHSQLKWCSWVLALQT